IEVYPAATLMAYGVKSSGYKKKDGAVIRKTLIEFLQHHLQFSCDVRVMEQDDNALDAVLCILAGLDFLRGQVIRPNPADIDIAKKEGWMWVRSLGTNTQYRE
ncbi:MAG: DUF429 domain-containing protein, partial [Chloroflexota bacterium]